MNWLPRNNPEMPIGSAGNTQAFAKYSTPKAARWSPLRLGTGIKRALKGLFSETRQVTDITFIRGKYTRL